MKLIIKIFLAATVLVIGMASIGYLQHRFDRADLKNALEAVQLSHPQGPEGPILLDLIEERLGVSPSQVIWVPRIESKLKGLMMVEAHYDAEKPPLKWQVDLVRYRVIPITEEAKALGEKIKN